MRTLGWALVALVLLVPGHAAVHAPGGGDLRPVAAAAAGPRPAGGARCERRGPRVQGPRIIGYASLNLRPGMSRRKMAHDMRRLTSMRSVDLIGWQETRAGKFGKLRRDLRRRGWRHAFVGRNMGTEGVAISWRRSKFRFLDNRLHRTHRHAGRDETRSPFPKRYVHAVNLRVRRGALAGLRVTLFNTHANTWIQKRTRFRNTLNARFAKRHFRKLGRLFRNAGGPVVLGTGDLNFGWWADRRGRPRGGISRTVGRHARSSYDALGTRRICATRDARLIDYAFLSRRSSRRGVRFARHATMGGFHTDHRAILGWVRVPRRLAR